MSAPDGTVLQVQCGSCLRIVNGGWGDAAAAACLTPPPGSVLRSRSVLLCNSCVCQLY